MKADVQALLERQAEWQRSRASMPWGEKLRMAVALRQSVLSFRTPSRHGNRPPRFASRQQREH